MIKIIISSLLSNMSQDVTSECSLENLEIIDDAEEIDPIEDIIDYLVRCAKISFKNAHVDEVEIRTNEKIRLAHDNFKKSPTNFITQFGKYLAPQHLSYFDKLEPYPDSNDNRNFQNCVNQLKVYHSADISRKRIRNRRYKALQKLKDESDYFSDKEMMYRDPLLYEQLVGQYLTNDEIRDRDHADHENLTFLNMILDTVDNNEMREMKNRQTITENYENENENLTGKPETTKQEARWGEFEVPSARVEHKPEVHKQTIISAPERQLLHEEFLQEMFSSFIEGRDEGVDYHSIDNDEQYDDLNQVKIFEFLSQINYTNLSLILRKKSY